MDPGSCDVDLLLSFLQFLLETGLTELEEICRRYVVAISDNHMGYGGYTIGFQSLVKCFLKGAQILSLVNSLMGSIGIVLKALTEPQFEPLDRLKTEFPTIKRP